MITEDAGELMHMEGPSTFQQCSSFHAGVLSSVRHHLKKNHFHAFDALLDALQHNDEVYYSFILYYYYGLSVLVPIINYP